MLFLTAANCALLQGVLSLKKSYFEPRYILLIPTQVESYISRLSSRGLYTPAQMKAAVSRIELYAATDRRHPGFFDCVIPIGRLRRNSVAITANISMNAAWWWDRWVRRAAQRTLWLLVSREYQSLCLLHQPFVISAPGRPPPPQKNCPLTLA